MKGLNVWRIERGNYGQGYIIRVTRNAGNTRQDVWGYYFPHEMRIARLALEMVQAKRKGV